MHSLVILSLLLASQLELAAPHGEKAAVLFFIRADCPISNRYAPEIERIYKAYGQRGFDVHLVYSEPGLSAERMETHRREYQLSAPAVTDPEHRYVTLAHIHTTPSAAVFVNGRLVYDGRIDNRFVSFSKTRTSGIEHDLTGVLDAIEAGKTPPLHETTAVGCAVEDVQ
jgi:hypothetical protein